MRKQTALPGVIGQRLKSARVVAGITQQQAAERLNLARTTVVAIEKGERAIRPEELVSFAGLYGQSLQDLTRPQEPLPSVALQFRGNATPEAEARLEAQCNRLAEDYLYLEELMEAPMPRLLPSEVAPGHDPDRAGRLAAEDERRRLGLGTSPVVNLRSIMEERLGARFFLLEDRDDSKVSGVYFYQERAGAVICVNAAHHWRRRRWTAAHEYGHVLGSRAKPEVIYETGSGDGRRQSPAELFADAFARHLLMPTGSLERLVAARKQERGNKFVIPDIVDLADQFGVSFEAMCRALEEDGLVRKNTFEWVRAQGFRPTTADLEGTPFGPDALTNVVPPRFQRLAVAAYRAERISEGTLIRLLRMERFAARALVLRLAQAPEEDRESTIDTNDVS